MSLVLAMGRIFFLSAVALLAYKYIARSNQKHQPLNSGKQTVLPPAQQPAIAGTTKNTAIEEAHQPRLVAAGSSAVEPDPQR